MGPAHSESVYRRPAGPLRPFIDHYVGYRLIGHPPGVHRGLPGPHLTFIVSIGEPIDVVAQTDRRQAPHRYAFTVGGLQASPALIAHHGRQEGVAIALTPLGSRAVLGVPAAALWNTSLEADEVMGAAAVELWERVNHAPDWESRFAACDAVLGRAVGSHRDMSPPVQAAWRLLTASGGSELVGAVASHVGWSRRHLNSRFSQEFGLPPKVAARVVRFDRARRLLMRPGRPSLAQVAAACGYYDQPHLNRDFVEFAGCSPGQWLAAEIPSVQDGNGVKASTSAV